MRRFLTVAIFVLASMAVFAQGKCKGSIFDEDGYVNVRKGMSTNTAVLRRLDSGTDVYFTPTGTNWYHISLSPTGQYIGYVYANRVDTWGTFSKYEATYDFVVTDPDGYTNVRKFATTKSPIVKKLSRNKHFWGKYAVDADGWIGVFGDNGLIIGFVYHTKVKKVSTVIQ